jgi:hypothetical protein
MFSIKFMILYFKKAEYLLPVITFDPLKSLSLKEDKESHIAFKLKIIQGHPSDATRHMK